MFHFFSILIWTGKTSPSRREVFRRISTSSPSRDVFRFVAMPERCHRAVGHVTQCWPRAIQHTTCATCFQVLVRVDIIRSKSMTVGATCFRHVQRLFPVGQLFCVLPCVCQHVSPCDKTRYYLPFEFWSLEFRFMACTSRFFAENVRSQFECAVTLVRVHCEHPTSV